MDVLTKRYGPLASLEGDLYLPDIIHPPVLCLLHGGFWRIPYGREQMTPIANDLAYRGFAVWNMEYRRLGTPANIWPGIVSDVTMGIEYLSSFIMNGIDINPKNVTVIGHSAGGHLALLSAASIRKNNRIESNQIQIKSVVGQAPLVDLIRAFDLGVGGNSIAELLGGIPMDYPERYQESSPMALLPLGVPQLLLHGTADNEVPIEMTRAYAKAAGLSGDLVEFVELAGIGHMEYLDPQSKSHSALCDWLINQCNETTNSDKYIERRFK
jgi:acetyl esterase/lipase